MTEAVTTVLIAVVKALDAAGVGGSSGRAKTFEYDLDGQLEEGVEITLLYPRYAAQRIEARSDETPEAVQPEGREPGPKDAPK